MKNLVLTLAAAAALALCLQADADAQPLQVTRATLSNGLQVVVVRDPLAPVVTAVLNYRAGSGVQQYPGEAHALEHMMFRGTPAISQTQLFEIGQLMGGDYDADTQGELTQFFFSAPAQYLDVALHVEADRATHLNLTPAGWKAERGAIEQEVTQDDSVALQKLFLRTILPALFKGTPYANDTLGTLESFNTKIGVPVLRRFYDAWYHPNNAVYVIAGDVDGPATIAKVRRYFGAIPSAKLPARPRIVLSPVHPATYHVSSDQPYSIVAIAFRSPGVNDKDYAAAQIAEAVLNNQRSDLYALVATGKSLFSGVQDIETHPRATASAVFSAIPVTMNPDAAAADLRSVIAAYRKSGLPADLVETEKQRAVAQAEFRGNSIADLALEWSQDLAQAGQTPDEQLTAIKRVTVDDVNRAFRRYLDPATAIIAYAVPKNAGAVNTGASGPAQENNTFTPSKAQPLPVWAQAIFSTPQVPAKTLNPVSMTLSNGVRLIVQPESVTHTVVALGRIATNEAVQAPAEKLGVADIAAGLFPFGTERYNRVQLREELDKIAADVQAGTDFSLRVLSSNFDRGVALLADEELHPAFPEQAFGIVKQQEVGQLTGQMTAPDHLSAVALNKALYPPGDPLQRFSTPQTAGAVGLADVQSYYAAAYRPDMTSIVVIGDITPDAARATFEKYFGAWKSQGEKPDVVLPSVPRNSPGSADVPDVGRVQSQVQLAQVFGLRRADADWAQLAVADNILGGGGFGSLLMDDLRVAHGYVYNVYTALDSRRNRSTFTIGYACDPDKILPAQRLAIADLRSLQTRGVSPARLVRAKSMLMSEVPLALGTFDGVARQLLTFSALALPLDQAWIDASRELSATPESVQTALRKWIDPNAFVRVVQGPAPK